MLKDDTHSDNQAVCVCVCVCVRVRACVSVCVCAPKVTKLLITSDMIWTPFDWLNNFFNLYMAALVGIVSRCGLALMHIIETTLTRVS